MPALLKAADDPDAQIRRAALAALGSTIELGDLPVLIAGSPSRENRRRRSRGRRRSQRACVRMPDREACAAKLAAAMAQAPVAGEVPLPGSPRRGGRGQGPGGGRGRGQGRRCGSPGRRQPAAGRVDDGRRGAGALGPGQHCDRRQVQEPAPCGAISASPGNSTFRRQECVAMCREASQLCRRDEEKKLVLEVLQRNPCAEGLSLAVPYLDTPALKAEAGAAAVAIAEKVVEKDPAAVAGAMKAVIAAGVGPDVTRQARGLLERANGK